MSVEEASEEVEIDNEVEHEAEEAAEEGEAVREEHAEKGEEDDQRTKGAYNATEVNKDIFEELHLGESTWQEVQGSWSTLLRAAESREAAGEAIYAALFDAAPSLQSLFKTPRAVMAMRFMNGLNQIINTLNDPKALKVVVETLGFQHLDLEVTPPRVVIFRDAICDLLSVELGARFTKRANDGWRTFLNYVGGSYIYVRVTYAIRIKILESSWATANNRTNGEDGDEVEQEAGGAPDANKEGEQDAEGAGEQAGKDVGKGSLGKEDSGNENGNGDMSNNAVPTTYNDMFMFNAAVMGFRNSGWMTDVLASFDAVVCNVANSYRLQEECDVLSLRLAKYKGSSINLPEYKAVMLASLRSLVPKDWNSDHEVAWTWLWENVERMLKGTMGKPALQERALAKLWGSLDEKTQMYVRREVYAKFFALAPAGQDYFKQSTTRLHFIADRVVVMSLDMFKEPVRMVEDISALGLRHVGYGIPTDLFGAFVSGCVAVVRSLTDDDMAEDAFRWSLSLISRILTRVINEGSTIVMKAINANSNKMLKKAVGCAPRGKRALWMLNVQVGTQSISPLLWAIETGSLEAAGAIIVDLLTIRADRDRYYYGMDTMFQRHSDIIRVLCNEGRGLLPTLFDGLIWRSRVTENGQRRVNYYLKHLLVNEHGKFNEATEWIVETRDPKIVCHPVIAMVTDMVWNKVAFRSFLFGRLWFLFTLIVFVCSQSILNHLNTSEVDEDSASASATDSPTDSPSDGDHGNTAAPSSHGDRMLATSPSSFSPGGDFIGHRRLAEVMDSEAVRLLNSGLGSVDAATVRQLAGGGSAASSFELRVAIFCCRTFIYVCSMGQLIYHHCKRVYQDCKANELVKIGFVRLPAYLTQWQGIASLLLTSFLFVMLTLEPIVHCIGDEILFTEHCPEGESMLFPYSVFCAMALFLYYLLLIDLAVFSTRVSAFVLVCSRLLSEVALFLFGLAFFALAFASAISALEQDDPDFAGIPMSGLVLIKISFGMLGGPHFDVLHDYPALLIAVIVYIIATVVFLLNLLIAQLNCAYQSTYLDMLGFARLNRGKIVTETMPSVPEWRWQRFLGTMKLDERCEFGEGDLGVTGGIQVWEPAAVNVTTVDMIRRFGGSTSVKAQWPEEAGEDEDDQLDRIEKLVEKAIKRLSSGGDKKGGKNTSTGGGSSDQAGNDVSGSGGHESGGSE